MDVIWLLVYWLVLLTAIYVAYSAVREAEQSLLRRPLSVLLTLAAVAAGTGLLIGAFNLVTNNYVAGNSSYLNYYSNGALARSDLRAAGTGVGMAHQARRAGPCRSGPVSPVRHAAARP